MGNSFSKEGSDVRRRDDSRRRGYGARRRPGSCADTLGALASPPPPPQINNKRRRVFNACQRSRKCPVGLSQLETAAYWTQQGGGRPGLAGPPHHRGSPHSLVRGDKRLRVYYGYSSRFTTGLALQRQHKCCLRVSTQSKELAYIAFFRLFWLIVGIN